MLDPCVTYNFVLGEKYLGTGNGVGVPKGKRNLGTDQRVVLLIFLLIP